MLVNIYPKEKKVPNKVADKTLHSIPPSSL